MGGGQEQLYQPLFCVNKEHAHYSRNIFPDCNDCINNNSSSSSSQKRRANSSVFPRQETSQMQIFQNEKQAPKYFMMNNHLLSESCQMSDYREYAMYNRSKFKSDFKKRHDDAPEQCMQDKK